MSNALCNQSMEIFYECYGAEAGLAALKWLPYGGLYLTGTLHYSSLFYFLFFPSLLYNTLL